MICEACGRTAPALKTVRWKTGGGRKFVLCDGCYAPLAGSVWITRGRVPVHGFCPGCSGWYSVRELAELRPSAWKWDAPLGRCRGCAAVE